MVAFNTLSTLDRECVCKPACATEERKRNDIKG